MKRLRNINPGYGQFRWVVFLLAVAVILPTVCLLWFMGEVVKNERLVVRQKLTRFYKGRLAAVTDEVNRQWADSCTAFAKRDAGLVPYQRFVRATVDSGYDGLVLYDATDRRLYPALSADDVTFTGPAEVFADAWELEFVAHNYERAAERYEQYARISDGPARLAARIGKSRSLAKSGDLDAAINECKLVVFSPISQTGDERGLVLIANAGLLLLGWAEAADAPAVTLEETFDNVLGMLYRSNRAGAALPADQNVFIARKLLEIGRRNALFDNRANLADSERLSRLIAAEERSIRFAEAFPTAKAFESWPPGALQDLSTGETQLYGVLHRTAAESCVVLLSASGVAAALSDYDAEFQDVNVDYRLLDDAGRQAAGIKQPQGEPFAVAPAGPDFPGWTVELYFKGGEVFDRVAGERIGLYTWAGVNVILLIFLSGIVAVRAISKQVKLNKLKNDFIATVTHELKTPLASTRVLVDTLLEGNYRDEKQVTEYLQLISRENERLSRLIDNFLTFSRMERNKQAFQMRRARPAAIARAAAEAVQTKFSQGHCHFRTDFPDDLPDIMADPDAMVTVLVNLLDNAYKYSRQEKDITLQVSHDNGAVRFSVSDRGVGIPRRAARKIFKRFYQVDRSLSRYAEGCGLGLSIARFIVDAHRGQIAVDSKPGRGSTFTVTIPATAAAVTNNGKTPTGGRQ